MTRTDAWLLQTFAISKTSKNMMRARLIITMLLFPAFFSHAEEDIRGVVTKVIDGNTIEVTSNNDIYKVILHGIDSPEPGQHYAEQARKMLERLLLRKDVTLKMHGKDRLGNRLAEIIIDGKLDPRRELLNEGLAWTSEREPNPELESLKEQARLQGRGLWGEQNPTPPWTYRRQQTMMVEKTS
jgi:micrococcal nuclease